MDGEVCVRGASSPDGSYTLESYVMSFLRASFVITCTTELKGPKVGKTKVSVNSVVLSEWSMTSVLTAFLRCRWSDPNGRSNENDVSKPRKLSFYYSKIRTDPTEDLRFPLT